MSNILLTWIVAVVGFIILELLTATFYGLSLALSAGVTALYVYLTGENLLTVTQGVIFVVASAIFAYLLPKLLTRGSRNIPQGMDQYITEKRTVKKAGGDLKISLDGVDYLIESDDEIVVGDKVEIIGHKGASMKVKKI